MKIRDSAGADHPAELFYVSPTQINFLIPTTIARGAASVSVLASGTEKAIGPMMIAPVKPGLFTADSSGTGIGTGLALRVKADGSLVYEPIVRFDAAQNQLVPIPIDLGPESEQVFVVLFGTGLRNRSAADVRARIGGEIAPVSFAGAQGYLAGLDQVNALLPRTLTGRGQVDVVLTVNGAVANTIQLSIK